MTEPSQLAQVGLFVFDLKQRVLARDGKIVPLAPKDAEILLLLIQNRGQIAEKKEIIEKVWPKTFVEEANISRHIFNLRRILSENGQRSIETIPKRGYRLSAPLQFYMSPAEGSDRSDILPSDETGTARELRGRGASPRSQSSFRRYFDRRITSPFLIVALMLAALLFSGAMYGLLRTMAPHRLSLAILPVQNFTGDPANEYICDGLMEQLIARFVALNPNDVGVVPRTSSMAYKTTRKTAGDIARELRVDYMLEGSLRKSAGRFRFTARLIRLPQQDQMWVREYDRTPTDLLVMEDEISQSIVELLADLRSGGTQKVRATMTSKR
jgi:TolB-like protein/DNA-binding winged helix-turn-helix (wHTH) protein